MMYIALIASWELETIVALKVRDPSHPFRCSSANPSALRSSSPRHPRVSASALAHSSFGVRLLAYTRRVKIYTRRGDAGETDLFGGPRVGKEHARVEAYGAVDELNASLGVCAATTSHDELRTMVNRIQGLLFDLGGYLASPDAERRAKSGVPEPRSS